VQKFVFKVKARLCRAKTRTQSQG